MEVETAKVLSFDSASSTFEALTEKGDTVSFRLCHKGRARRKSDGLWIHFSKARRRRYLKAGRPPIEGETVLLIRKPDPENPKPIAWAYPEKGDLEFLVRTRREVAKRQGKNNEELIRRVISGNNHKQWPFLAALLVYVLEQTEQHVQRTSGRCRFKVTPTRLERDELFLEIDNNPFLRMHYFAIVATRWGPDICDLSQPCENSTTDHLTNRLSKYGFHPNQVAFLVQIDTTSVDDGFQRMATVYEAARVPAVSRVSEAA